MKTIEELNEEIRQLIVQQSLQEETLEKLAQRMSIACPGLDSDLMQKRLKSLITGEIVTHRQSAEAILAILKQVS